MMDDPAPPSQPSAEAGPRARGRYHHGDLRRALVAAGLEILRETGLPGLTLRAIAARVGVSHTAPRNHFPSLGALHSAIAAEGFRMHAAAMQVGIGPMSTREERLRAAVLGYVTFALEHPELFALMFAVMRQQPDDPDRSAAAAASYAVLEGISRGLVWPGAAGDDRQQRTEAMLWSFVHGFATLAEGGQIARAVGLPCGPETAVRRPELVLSVLPDFRYEDEPQA